MLTELNDAALTRATPETQGIASSAILALLDDIERTGLEFHSLMLLRHGQVVAEGWWKPYGSEDPHVLFSLSKSFTSTAAGFAVSEGLLSVDDRVVSFFPEDVPAEISDNLKAMRVRDLLTMTTGHDADSTEHLHASTDGNWAKAFLQRPVEHAPGTHFVYNSGATYMVSAILYKVTGINMLEYLQPRLFAPLGIRGARWGNCPRGINAGGWGLSLKTEDIAKFGQLYLQKGMWNGQQVVPAAWVEEATSRQVSNGDNPENDWNQGYGYQFWRSRHNAYRGDGAFGQFCVVMPDQDAVVAITAGLGDMHAALHLVWKHLLPAMHANALPEESALREELHRRLGDLTVRAPQGQASSAMAEHVTGKRYLFETNDRQMRSAEFHFGEDRCEFRLEDPGNGPEVLCGVEGKWIRVEAAGDASDPQSVAATGAWIDAETFVARLCFCNTPFGPTLTFRFKEDTLTFDYRENVAFGPVERPQLVGRQYQPVVSA